ncbi:MAG TPA: PEP-CTERM sorting domain-containing protein [Lacipirellulaceae bacterium]|nr:PEP-CTERM sorting domain-containing protein [Lacipirellulaceae bacterium]
MRIETSRSGIWGTNILPRVCILAAAALLLATVPASAQSITFDFQDGTDQGFGNKFSNDASAAFPIVNIGGSNRMGVLRNGDFQEAERASTGATDPFLLAMNAATAAPGLYQISYDWYVDTSGGGYGNFLQLGTYMNSGQGTFPYIQDFPGTGKDVELNGTQLASGQVFTGTVTETVTQKYGALHPDFLAQPFTRFGLIINGDGPNATVYFDNISIRPIPEPVSLALFALAAPAMLMLRRRS